MRIARCLGISSIFVLGLASAAVMQTFKVHSHVMTPINEEAVSLKPAPNRGYPFASSPAPGSVDEALWEARAWQLRAQVTVNKMREMVENWDAQATNSPAADEAWRLQLLAEDPHGYLRQARAAVLRAAKRAKTPREMYTVAWHRADIEHEAGYHAEELQHAYRLAQLEPDDPIAGSILRRAKTCNRRRSASGRFVRGKG